MDASSTQSVNITETFDAYRIYKLDISARTIYTSFDFHDFGNGEVVCIVLCPKIRSVCAFMSDPAIDASASACVYLVNIITSTML